MTDTNNNPLLALHYLRLSVQNETEAARKEIYKNLAQCVENSIKQGETNAASIS